MAAKNAVDPAEAQAKNATKARVALIQKIEALRDSRVICFITSLRPGATGSMADDAVRAVFEHLLKLPKRPISKLDIFLCSNGGSSTVPWRLVSLFREFTKKFSVIIPYRAYSAATLLALGADEIVMHPFGELGPIDPTVSNDFNPVEEGTNRRLGISVEDVKAYVTFIKSTVGITHEDELVKAIEILANKVHPLALGNVERFISQSRMMGRKIMSTHMAKTEAHTIDDIVENLASKLYFHGHPINRQEAKEELKLKVNLSELTLELEKTIWDLHLLYEKEFNAGKIFNPASEIARLKPFPPPQPVPVAPPGQQVMMQPPPTLMAFETTLLHAMIESNSLASRYLTQRRFYEILIPGQPLPQIKEDVISQGWNHS